MTQVFVCLCSVIADQISVNIAAVEIDRFSYSAAGLRSSQAESTNQLLDVWFRAVASSDKDAVQLALLLSTLISNGVLGDVLKLKVQARSI